MESKLDVENDLTMQAVITKYLRLGHISTMENHLFIPLKDRNLPIYCLSLQNTYNSWDQTEISSQEFNLNLPPGCQGPKYLRHHLLPAGVRSSRKPNLKLC